MSERRSIARAARQSIHEARQTNPHWRSENERSPTKPAGPRKPASKLVMAGYRRVLSPSGLLVGPRWRYRLEPRDVRNKRWHNSSISRLALSSGLMPDEFERRSRLVVLAYSVLGAMDLPTPETSDREILSAMADVALQKAAQVGPETPSRGRGRPEAGINAATDRIRRQARPCDRYPASQSDGTAQGDTIGA
jgi:hypothetical protein